MPPEFSSARPDRHGTRGRLFSALVLALLAAGLGVLCVAVSRDKNIGEHAPEFIAAALAAGILYAAAVYLAEKFSVGGVGLGVILVAAAAFRLTLLAAPPSLSEDVYRYQWEGRVIRAGLNPYTVTPASPDLRWLQDPAHPLRTGFETPAVYPPLAEMILGRVETVSGAKRIFTALDFASLALLLLILYFRKEPLVRVINYAWNPAVLFSFAMCGHLDSLAIAALLIASFFIIARRAALSSAFLALATLGKLFPALLLPVYLQKSRLKHAGIFAGLVVLGYLPFASAGRGLFSGLGQFAAGWEANDSLFGLILAAGNSKPQAELVAVALLGGLAAFALKSKMQPMRAGLFLLAGLLLLSPAAFPWYFTWTVPFLCFTPSAPWLLMTVTCALGYAPVVAYAAGQPYRHSPFILALEYAPVIAWLGFRAIHKPLQAVP